ncbi:MAG: elongation factor P hydroxylase, partial [Halioglobus sp.]
VPSKGFDCARLEAVFDRCFADSENTRLIGGAAEPFYQPATIDQPINLLYFREDYFASALHEIAHWCIAGAERRKQLDFGYWYAPEGRSDDEQKSFEQVEVKPQALEWYFSSACHYPFRISVDNFGASGELPDTSQFRCDLVAQALYWQETLLPERALQFFNALAKEFETDIDVDVLEFDAEAVA